MHAEPVKIFCPLPAHGRINDAGQHESDYFIVRPARWLGKHAVKRDEVVEKANGRFGNGEVLIFAISMALADDWNLPGIGGNPENWDFTEIDLDIIRWVNREIFNDFAACGTIKKN